MQEQIFKDLEKLDHKFSNIETELGMPKNYLSRFKNPENVLPKKWFEPLQNYILKHLPNEASQNAEYPLEPKDMIEAPKFLSPKTKMVVDKDGFKQPSVSLVATEEMNKINKDFGAGTVMYFGSKPATGYQTISTGSLLLNDALGIGGLPRGRIVEIFGWESSGKTTIALYAIADAQRQKLKCLLIDAENAFDPEYATALGVNVEELQYCQPTYGEEGFEVVDRLVSSGKADVVVIDSVAAMLPKAEIEGEMGDSKMGLHARLMSQVCRKIVSTVAKHNALVIFINQLRYKIGVTYGSPEVTTGGMALQFYASMRLEVRRSTSKENTVMNGDVKEGNKTTVKVVKNKCSPPFKTATFNIMYGTGIDTLEEIVDLAVDKGIIEKSGSWYSYKNSKLGQGTAQVKQLLIDNPDMKKEIELKLKESI